MPLFDVGSYAVHSTPRAPKLKRRRSLSVGCAPISTSAPKVALSGSTIFSPRRDTSFRPEQTPKKNASSQTTTRDEPKSLKRKYPQSLIDVCAEFDRQHQELKAMHARNKEEGRYHLCPKMNFESTSSTDNDFNLTDRSCNSTCICQKDKEDTKDVTSSVGSKSTSGTRLSSFLYLSDGDDEEPEAADSKKSCTESPSSAAPPSAVLTASATATCKKPTGSHTPVNTGNRTTSTPSSASSSGSKTSNGPAKKALFHSKHYTQIRPEISPQAALFKHLKDVNTSGCDLDATLVPSGSAIIYDPDAKYPVTLDIEDDNTSPSKSAPMSPGTFYKPKPWKK